MRLQAEQKGISLVARIQPGLPAVRADLEKTAWVLINFLTDAIRYSAEGTEAGGGGGDRECLKLGRAGRPSKMR